MVTFKEDCYKAMHYIDIVHNKVITEGYIEPSVLKDLFYMHGEISQWKVEDPHDQRIKDCLMELIIDQYLVGQKVNRIYLVRTIEKNRQAFINGEISIKAI